MAVQDVLGGEVAWHADLDPGASTLLAHHWPDVPNLGDITAVDWHSVPTVDVLTAGYPCQPFSLAGDRKGTDDDRHLWPHIARAVDALRPRLVYLENVDGHLSLGFADVLADLARLGLDASWTCVRASDVGAAHQRNRLFAAAWPAPADTAHVGHERPRSAWAGRPGPADRRPTAPDAEGQRHGNPGPQGERGLSSAAVRGGAAAPADADRGGQRPDQHDVRPGQPDVAWGLYEPAIRRAEQAFGRRAPWPVDDRGRLDPPFVEWHMGLPAGHVTAVPGLTRNEQLRLLGNGVVPQQATYALCLLLDRAPEALAALPALDPARSL